MNLADLRDALLTLTDEQLISMAESMGIDYASLGGLGKFGRTRELVERARRSHKLDVLTARVEVLRAPAAPTSAGDQTETNAPASEPGARVAGATAGSTPGRLQQSPLVAALVIDTAQSMTVSGSTVVTAGDDAMHAAPSEHLATIERTRREPVQPALRLLLLLIALLAIGTIVLLFARRAVQSPPANTPQPTATAQRATQPTVASVATSNVVALVSPTAPPTTASATAVGTRMAPTVSVVSTAVATPQTPNPTNLVTVSVTQLTRTPPVITPLVPAATPSPTAPPPVQPTPTRNASQLAAEPGSAGAFINEINSQVTDYLQGRSSVKDLEANWQGSALPGVQDFLNVKVPASLAVGGVDKRTIASSMRYLTEPTVLTDAAGAIVTVRESWKYSSKVSGKTVCETRDYSYRLVKSGERFKVDEFTGKLVDVKCATE